MTVGPFSSSTTMSNSSLVISLTKPRLLPPAKGTRRCYSPAAVNFTNSSAPSTNFSVNACLAGSRAILRHQISVDNDHLSVRRDGGLHPMYLALHGGGRGARDTKEIKQLLDDSFKDIIDAVSIPI